MANKKGPLGRALDRINAFFGIKPKKSILDRAAEASAGPKTQGKVIRYGNTSKVYKPIEIDDAKEVRDLYDNGLKLYGEGKDLLLKIIAAKNEEFAKEIHKRPALEERYFNFIKVTNRLIKNSSNNKVVTMLQKLGYTKILDDKHQEIHLPMIADLKKLINQIKEQMQELRNKRANGTTYIEEPPTSNLIAPIQSKQFSTGTLGSVKSTSRDFNEIQFQEIKNDDDKTLDSVFTEFNKYMANIEQKIQKLSDTNTLEYNTELRQYGDELKQYAVNFLRTLPENLKSHAAIIIEMSEYRTTMLGIDNDIIKEKQIALKQELQDSLTNQNLLTQEIDQLQKALTAILLWQDSNKGIETFKQKYPEIIQYTPFIENLHKNQP